jgi:membrane protein implicated in regulation of membrane protease activity
MITALIGFLIVLAIVALILWGVTQIPGLPPWFKNLAYVIIGVILLLYLYDWVAVHGATLPRP